MSERYTIEPTDYRDYGVLYFDNDEVMTDRNVVDKLNAYDKRIQELEKGIIECLFNSEESLGMFAERMRLVE